MSSFPEAITALWPLAALVAYFVVTYIVVERTIVRKKLLNDYQLKAIDLAWVWVSAIQLAFLVLSVREGVLRDRINSYQAQSAVLRDTYLNKSRDGTFQCMDGTWPSGAVKGKSYQENGNRVTDACSGVSGALNLFSGFFHDEQLWRYPPSPMTAAKFEEQYDSVFGRGFEQRWSRMWAQPRATDQLTLEAKEEFAKAASEIVRWQTEVGRAATEQKIIRVLTSIGIYWPIVTATSVAFALGKARLAMRDAKQKAQSDVT